MRNMLIRALTGAIYVILLVGCIVYSPVTSFFFFGLVAATALYEFGTLANNHAGASLNRRVNAFAGFLLVATVWLWCMGSAATGKAAALYALSLLYILVGELYRKEEDPLRNWAFSFASQLYIAVPFSMIPLVCLAYDTQAGQYNYTWIYTLALFIFLWTNDTGAYLSGMCLHRFFPAKLFPRISPKKTWVGSIGGGLLTLGASVLVWHLSSGSFTLPQWMGFSLVVVVFGTWGDLVESLLKRQLGIKDSGHILPGHGGILDRMDSSLLAIPATVAYIYLVTA